MTKQNLAERESAIITGTKEMLAEEPPQPPTMAKSVQMSRTSLASGASSSNSASDDVSQYPVHSSIDWQGCAVYRGEGNANLVVALPLERKVIRLRKSAKSADESTQSTTEAEELQRVRREAEFIRSVISGFLGEYVRAPEILRCEGPEIARLAEKIRLARPEHRRNKEIIEGYATKYPDYTLLPNHLSIFSTEPTYCVEIKPKQGYLCKADRLFKKCPYCLMQYHKLQKGSTKKPSSYCPFDLFSNEPVRMDSALTSLLRSPQNNLKIFKNGQVIFNDANSWDDLRRILDDWFSPVSPEHRIRAFLDLIRTALTRPFDSKNNARIEKQLRERDEVVDVLLRQGVDAPARLKPELVKSLLMLLLSESAGKECIAPSEQRSVDALARGSVLERILRMQQLHRCGQDVVAWLASKFSPRLDDQLIYADLLASSSYTSLVQDKVNSKISKTECKRKEQSCNKSTMEEMSNVFTHSGEESFESEKQPNSLKDVTIESCIKIIGNYLLFCTARDCSILMAFQKVDRKSQKHISSDNIISLSNELGYLVAVRVLDLDMKSLTSIEKHCQRDNDVIEACIKELTKQKNVS